ncbi:MAG: cytochrome c maturation protein CcmE [Alphaproteobacteria bacterium]|nr:MAG: cytochrome c maturation protein CcmE [Alphaproteobacteria bacterium]
MKPKHKRLIYIVALLCVLGASAGLVLYAFRDNMQFFYSPTEIKTKILAPGQIVRLGGMVEVGSIKKVPDGIGANFRLTDFENTVAVEYRGVLPDLFKENSGAVVIGAMRDDGVFAAQSVLAKHDENYMPPEVAKSLKKPSVPPHE